jgi:hypothetical protein
MNRDFLSEGFLARGSVEEGDLQEALVFKADLARQASTDPGNEEWKEGGGRKSIRLKETKERRGGRRKTKGE